MKVRNKNIVVEDVVDIDTSLIYVPKHFKDRHKKLVKAKVIGVSDENADKLPVGSVILYQKNTGIEIEHEKKTLRVIQFNNVMAAQVTT